MDEFSQMAIPDVFILTIPCAASNERFVRQYDEISLSVYIIVSFVESYRSYRDCFTANPENGKLSSYKLKHFYLCLYLVHWSCNVRKASISTKYLIGIIVKPLI